MAANICFKPKGSWQKCPHFRFDSDRYDMACYVSQDSKKGFNYRGYDIEPMYNNRPGYTVDYCGDDVFFNTIEQAVSFINEISDVPTWNVTFIWGYTSKMTTLTVSAESEADAIDTALEIAGRAFESRVLLVKKN